MAKTKGITAQLEDWLAAQLAALQEDGEDVFRTAEPWQHQLTRASLKESFPRYSPFAFVSYFPFTPAREGDYDLDDVLRFAIMIGVEYKEPGIARRGDDDHLGISRMRDLVIAALDDAHPGESFTIDNFEYVGENDVLDEPKRYMTELQFQARNLKN